MPVDPLLARHFLPEIDCRPLAPQFCNSNSWNAQGGRRSTLQTLSIFCENIWSPTSIPGRSLHLWFDIALANDISIPFDLLLCADKIIIQDGSEKQI